MVQIIKWQGPISAGDLIERFQLDTHVILMCDDMVIHEHQLNAIPMHSSHIFVDYTVHNKYINFYHCFGNKEISSNEVVQPYLCASCIYNSSLLKSQLKDIDITFKQPIDVMLYILSQTDTIATDGHIVFNFNTYAEPDRRLLIQLSKYVSGYSWQQYMQYYRVTIARQPFNQNPYTLLIDKLNKNVKLPNLLYRALYQWSFKRKIAPYQHLLKEACHSVNESIVFMGFDYQFRGNSKYLAETISRDTRFKHYKIYFVCDAPPTPLINLNIEVIAIKDAKAIIENAGVVILESFPPDDFYTNGTVINLWHGTPIKQLFLDSREPEQNANIFLYRLRKYNKLRRTDYFITDTTDANHLFASAFNIQTEKIVAAGYPRVHYLKSLIRQDNLEKLRDEVYKKYHLDKHKQLLLYLPTWKSYDYESVNFSSLHRYEVIAKPHPESKQSVNGIVSDLPTEDLLAICDAVITDYSSVVFDALAINKRCYMLMDDYEQYMATRGVYDDVIETLSPMIYTSRKDLLKAIESGTHYKTNHFVNVTHSNQSIHDLILQSFKNNLTSH
ncbi:CDP-glycerol glycerophosphotransferase family protein [Macrococcus armenti]|uniref:CDP-glycerol glycerophosphotransferase family protein n=1 Tax=Macrococcus armenti TaxID=2875764 RepID=UPI001CCA808F|nr:CDP-glycerol glycerophosphotransferase family protein [Macrococcus armenti]UBH09341.1 CDP-glycerol glycerophosphotransferase family protein [Macrococcus armenti]UBH11638.1 CDP-glycerol glycerophosphotransferase family protein [Macrococcus armenti]